MLKSRQIVIGFLTGAAVWAYSPLDRSFAAEEGTPVLPGAMSDVRLSREIHSTLVADSSLPYCAHVISVNAEKGVVTLKGLVHTPQERERVKRKAAKFVGEQNVISEIRIKG